MPLGYLLKRLREERGLSQRELGRMSGVDSAYIARLETKAKESPSEQVARKLITGLSLAGRDAWLLGYVARFREYVDVGMVKYALDNPAISEEEFSWAVALRFRRPETRRDYPRLFGCARQIIAVVDRFATHSRSPSLRGNTADSRAK